MKQLFFAFLFSFCFFSSSFSQPYFFEQSAEPYTNLTGTTSINAGAIWSSFQSFSVPIGFNFGFMGNTYSTIYVEGSGFTRFDPSYYYLINPFTVALEDKGTSSSLSPLSYKLEGSAPGRILKIEWSNCGFVNDATGTANFQLWLYETSNIIEVHIGSCTATSSAYTGNGDTGPAIGIYEFSSVSFCVYGIGLLDNPAAANDSVIQNANADLFDFAVNSTPTSGTVYRFTPGGLSLQEFESVNWEIYFHQQILTIESKIIQHDFVNLYVIDASGKFVFQKQISSSEKIDMGHLKSGIHFCILTSDDEIILTKKIVAGI